MHSEVTFKILNEDIDLNIKKSSNLEYEKIYFKKNSTEEEMITQSKKLEGKIISIDKNFLLTSKVIGRIEKTSKTEEKSIVFSKFFPINNKITNMYVRKVSPEFFIERKKIFLENKIEDLYFIGKYLEWPNYSKLPLIDIEKHIGKMGNIDIEIEILLRENNYFFGDFNKETYNYLKKFNQYIDDYDLEIPKEENSKKKRIFKRGNYIYCK